MQCLQNFHSPSRLDLTDVKPFFKKRFALACKEMGSKQQNTCRTARSLVTALWNLELFRTAVACRRHSFLFLSLMSSTSAALADTGTPISDRRLSWNKKHGNVIDRFQEASSLASNFQRDLDMEFQRSFRKLSVLCSAWKDNLTDLTLRFHFPKIHLRLTQLTHTDSIN